MPDFSKQRKNMVDRYKKLEYIRSKRIEEAIKAVPRELFMDPMYRDYAYVDQPFPIPGDGMQTISAPYMYPITYEALRLEGGERFLEIGCGSGYGAAIAYEAVGPEGLVVSVEINEDTYRFAKNNLMEAGYTDVILVLGDGGLGYPPEAPYDAVSITASIPRVPPPIIEQMADGGRLVAPVGHRGIYGQELILMEKKNSTISQRKLMSVAYVPLTGKYGYPV